jgi:signal transduction histidine kinase
MMSGTIAHSPPTSDHARRVEELGRIIMAYSEVTERLQQSHDQLTRQVEHLRRELGEKNRQLERRNRLAALGEMAAGMAHEIRNPLGGIQLYASLLSRDLADRPESRALVGKISGGVRRLESLVSQVLNFTGEIRIAAVPMDLASVVRDTLELVRQQQSAKQVTIDVRGPDALLVRADPALLGQALLNLLLNAIEAVSCGGHVQVAFAAAKDEPGARQFTLSVCDNGPGIDPQALDRIFNPFFTTRDTGTGLGLAIVHRIVEAHEGAITAWNAPEGGARFQIRV